MSAWGAEIKQQFAQNLLLCDSVLSQLFIRQNAADEGRVWQLTTNCKPLPLDFFVKHFDTFRCFFNVRAAECEGETTIYFQGPAQPLSKLANDGLHSKSTSGLLALSLDHCKLQMAESTREMAHILLFPTQTEEGYAVCESTIKRHFVQFVKHCDGIETRLLALATGIRVDRASGLLIGLIIARQHSESLHDHWKRVGVCIWSLDLQEVNSITRACVRVPDTRSGDESWGMLRGFGAG